jgi:hypothetical protein
MDSGYRALFATIAFVTAYGLILWAAVRWARSRLLMRAQLAARALTAVGARVLEVRPSPSLGRAAEVDFELDGLRSRFDVRRWGRDWIECAVYVGSPALPAILIRAERGVDRVGKSLGLTREVQVGDADFDAAAFIVAAAPDAQVLAVLQPAEVRRRVRDVLALGYRVDMSSAGLRATRLQSALTAFDGAPVPAVMRALEALVAALPAVDPATLTTPRVRSASGPAVAAIVFGGVAFAAMLGFANTGHAPLRDTDSLRAMGLGVVAWVFAMAAVVRLMRGRSQGMVEIALIALGLFIGVPSCTAIGLFAANSGLDHGEVTTHEAQVVLRQRRDSEVFVVPGITMPGRQKVGVSRALWRELAVGDTIEVDTHPGALGWPWVSAVRRRQ